MKESIELHTIGIFRGKEYEMQELFNGLLEENQRLNNIINELEEYLEWSIGQDMYRLDFKIILDKLQELKGDVKE